MKTTIDLYDFREGFSVRDRKNFSYEGLEALFLHLEEYEESCDTEIEYNPIAFSCDFVEWQDFKEFQGQYPDIKTKEDIQDHTQFIDIDGESFITRQFGKYTITRYYENGQLESERDYKDGELDGLSKTWYYNGQLKSERNYKDDELDGLSETWYYNGQLKSERNYKDDKLDGLSKTWNDNGQLHYEGTYKDGGLIWN